jgi:LssY C-terminus
MFRLGSTGLAVRISFAARRLTPLLALLALITPARAQTIAEGTVLNVRLRHPLYSYSAERGQRIDAVLVAPATAEGAVLLPTGSELRGHLTDVRKVGFGLMRERARIGFAFDQVRVPDGTTVPIATRLHAVINARESLDASHRIVGIRATATLGYSASGWIVGAATSDPLLMTFSFVGSAMILRFAESEIVYPAGTELLVTVTAPTTIGRTFPAASRPVVSTPEEREALTAFVAKLPFRTATPASKPSDMTNVLLIGDAAAIDRAFHAAGWSTTDELNASTAYRTFRAMAEDHGYDAAPMSLLLLDGRPPHQTYQKGLNTFAKRHHLRLFQREERWNGQPVWPISSTQDIGIGFSRKARNFIHLIDTTIDNERNKVVNDLAYTGCVDAVDLIDRPFLPSDARNATNERLLTDGRMAIVQINACQTPRPYVEVDSDAPPGRARGPAPQRAVKQFTLSMKHQIWRGNIVSVIARRVVKVTKLAFVRKPHVEADAPTVVIDGVVYSVATDTEQEFPDAEKR